MNKRVAIALLLAATLLGGDWPEWAVDPGRTRVSSDPIGTSLSVAWSKPLSSEIVASPVTADGYIVLGTRDGIVRGLRESDGATLWSFDAGGEVMGTPVIRTGRVYAASRDGDLYALRLADGTQLWSVSLGGAAYSSPTFVNGSIIIGIGAPGAAVRAINPATGATVWETSMKGSVYSSAALDGGNVWVGSTIGEYDQLNATTGAPVSSVVTNGDVLLSSPMVAFGEVFVAPGGTNMNFHALGSWSVALSDPTPPSVGTIQGTRLDTSSPMKVGSLVCVVVRFDYYIDTDADFVNDTFTIQEYAVAIDPVAQAQVWQVALGTATGGSQNIIPTLGICPTPASVDGGSRLVVGSSVEATLRILNAADGAVVTSVATDAPGRSSPAVSNGRVLWGTDGGTLWSLQGATNSAPTASLSGFVPPDGASYSTVSISQLAWDAAFDVEDPPTSLRYIVRMDTDGEILEDWSQQIVTAFGVTSVTLGPPATPTASYTYAVRTEDSSGAMSGWSALQTFSVSAVPNPPTGLAATPSINAVVLNWTASSTQGVVGYRVRWAESGQTLGLPVSTSTTSQVVTGLTNGLTYDFDVRSVDSDGDESAPATVQATPTTAGIIAVNGVPFVDLASAVAAAVPGDTIQVGVGTFVVPADMTLEGVSLIGVSPHDTWLDATTLTTGITLIGDAGNTTMTLEHFSIFGAEEGIEVVSGTATITHLVVRDMAGDGIRISGPAVVFLVNNTLVDNGDAAVDVQAGVVTVRNNIIVKNGTGLRCAGPGAVANTYNDVFQNVLADYEGCEAGKLDFAAPVAFVDEAARDFRVRFGEGTIDAGDPADSFVKEPPLNGGRINVGAYGNTPWAATMFDPASASSGSSSSSFGLSCAAGVPVPESSMTLFLALIFGLGLVIRVKRFSNIRP